jgi:hypothetical protein
MAGLGGVLTVVQPEADDVRRVYRRQQLHVGKVEHGRLADQTAKWVAVAGSHPAVFDNAVASVPFIQVSDNSHQKYSLIIKAHPVNTASAWIKPAA